MSSHPITRSATAPPASTPAPSGTVSITWRRSPNLAVCLLPGTELAFQEVVRYEPRVGFFGHRKIAQRVARFRKINSHNPHAHHDALEFPDGEVVLLTNLLEGQRASVLQLPATPRVNVEAEEKEPQPAS